MDARLATVNSLLECGAHLFALTAPLRAGRDAGKLPADFREQVLSGFDMLERLAFERQIGTAVVQDAKYALAAFIDEAVLASEWPGRLEWMSQPLQLAMFGDHLAGEAFFTKLGRLRQGGEANLDLLELYYVCLQLGFEGMYKLRGLEQLMALQVDLRSQIDGYRGIPDPRLAPSGTVQAGVFARVGRHVPYWVIAAVTATGLFFGYAGYAAMLRSVTADSLGAIRHGHQQIVAQRLEAPRGKEAHR